MSSFVRDGGMYFEEIPSLNDYLCYNGYSSQHTRVYKAYRPKKPSVTD